jgi:hypothetical protein
MRRWIGDHMKIGTSALSKSSKLAGSLLICSVAMVSTSWSQSTQQLHVVAGRVQISAMPQPLKLAEQNPSQNLTESIKQVRSGNRAGIDPIIQAGKSKAVPILEDLFLSSQDKATKEKIALFLYKFGDPSGKYWDYILREAMDAVSSDAPFRFGYDGMGRMAGDSEDFIAWAKAHNMSKEDAFKTATESSGAILTLAGTEDARAIPTLRQGLSSQNLTIQKFSAMGLAQLQDKESIPLIISICERAPTDAATAIADSLVYFDDPSAKSAAAKFLPKERIAMLQDQARTQGGKPFPSVRVPAH